MYLQVYRKWSEDNAVKNGGILLMSESHNDLPTQQPAMKAHPIPNTKHVDIAKDQIDSLHLSMSLVNR